ncbi:MerR family transcriptional regulator [Ornithinibacillus scapharcae]|uniref:MerR family transcriptional regulator n=1 Tax=Ornithinibacillus scapharcae TaxID=1147159 RepID=UPI000225BCE8|nr:MerR family transcriptional regulator [Ornithinibacillus scapharcae]
MYTIGQLSKNTGVTVRTLDYYDEIGLIKPSSRTSGGHRLYNDEDVMRLERVLALKYMGFTLERIKDILKDSAVSWQQSIQEQLEMVKKEKERLKILEQALLGVSYSIEFEGDVNWPIIFSVIQMFQQDPEDALKHYHDYLDKEEMKKIIEISAEMNEEDIKEWLKIISDIKKYHDIDPNSELAFDLAQRWLNQATKMFGNDEDLLSDMWESLKNLKDGIAFYPMDKHVIGFLERVNMARGDQ